MPRTRSQQTQHSSSPTVSIIQSSSPSASTTPPFPSSPPVSSPSSPTSSNTSATTMQDYRQQADEIARQTAKATRKKILVRLKAQRAAITDKVVTLRAGSVITYEGYRFLIIDIKQDAKLNSDKTMFNTILLMVSKYK